MNYDEMKKVAEAFRERNNFLIMAHINPEGDSIGSQLAVRHILETLGKSVAIAGQDVVPENLKFLPGTQEITRDVPEDFHPETLIILDCPVLERVGRIRGAFDEEHFILNIDHHVSNEYFGDVNWVESDASSVGEMIFGLARELGIKIKEELAVSIYTAIVTDTGMFNYDNTSQRTHEVAGELISLGVNPRLMHGEIFEKKTIPEIKLLGKALTTLRMDGDEKIAYINLTREMYREEGIENISTDTFINFPRSIKGVEVALFFKENKERPLKINVSFRSSGGVDVNAVASCFGGGGHPRAAGCVLDMPLAEAQEKVLAEVRKALKK
ncbi:MAG: bifunctional oligoribonuclease/PAP phosphatase NrnA [Candidatus Omnitrophica bacterium]|nr:bifunctional oligoribonuclease/PAP phosphatase NrnA [Candidatus Omnitrophota bacterium]